MTIRAALSEGLRRVRASARLIVLLWLVNLVMALPLSLVMADRIQSSVGASLVHENLRRGFDVDWYEEFNYGASGLAKTFSPNVIGAAPFLANLEAWLDGSLFGGFIGVVSFGILFAMVWMFLLGGILDHFARRESGFSAARFFSAASRYFPRFLLLALLAGSLYALIYGVISSRLFSFLSDATRDVAAERPIFFLTAAAYLIVVFLLVLVNMAFDYAKIITVVTDQRNMVRAALAGFRFIRSHPGKTFGLYGMLGVIALFFLGVYSLIAPGVGQANGFTVLFSFLIGQAYLIIKLILRLTFFSGQMALYESMRSAVAATPSM
jgi:hypothetical protein